MKERSIFLGKALIYMAVFLTPLMHWNTRVYPHITSKVFFFEGLAILMLLNWIFLMAISPEYRPTKKTLVFFAPAVLFVAWLTVSSILGPDPTTAFWGYFMRGDGMILWYAMLAFAFTFASFVKVHGKNFLIDVFKVSFASSLLVTLFVWFNDDHLNLLGIFGGSDSIGNQSFTGPYLIFNICIGLFLWFSEFSKNKYVNYYSLGLVFILTSPIFFSFANLIGQARGAILGIVLGVILGSFVFISLSKKKFSKILGISLVFLFIISCIFAWNKLSDRDSSLHKAFVERASASRFLFWDSAKEGMKESPIFGFGKEGYRIMFQKNFKPEVLLPENNIEGFVDRAHNIIFDIGVWGGYPAVIFYYILLVSLALFTIMLFHKGRLTRLEASLVIGTIFAYFIQNLFVFDNTVTLLMFFVVIGAIGGLYIDDEVKSSWRLRKNHYILVFILLAVFVFSWVFLIQKPVKKSKVMYKIYNATISERPGLYKNLLGIHPMGDMYDVGDLSQENFRSYSRSIEAILPDAEKRRLAVEDLFAYLEYGDEVLKNNPYNYQLALNLARLGNVSLGLLDPASDTSAMVAKIFEWGEKARELSPNDPQVYWALGQTNIFIENFDKAVEYYKYAIELEPRIDWGHSMLIKLAHYVGDKKLYEEVYKRAKELFPYLNIEVK